MHAGGRGVRRGGWARALLILLLLLDPPVVRAGQENQGLQGGWAIDDSGNLNFTSSLSLHTPTLHEAEAGWLRINFRLGRCFADWTSVGCNGRTTLEVYDEVVDNALSRNFRVLGLLSNEAWHGFQSHWTEHNAEAAGGSGDNAYLRRFAEDAGLLARHFGDRVGHWEVWNEPDAWTRLDEQGNPAGGSFLYPSNFAWLLPRSYEEIKAARPDAVVISGGLFAHDQEGPRPRLWDSPCPSAVVSGAEYLCATYVVGLREAGWMRPYPFDHVGARHTAVGENGWPWGQARGRGPSMPRVRAPGWSPPPQHRPHAVRGAQDDVGTRRHRVPRHQAEPESRRDRGQEQRCLHQCERVADAEPRAGPEGEVGAAGQPLGQAVGPAVRIEALRVLEVAPVAVHDPLTHQDDRAGRDVVSTHLAIPERRAGEDPRRRVQPQRL